MLLTKQRLTANIIGAALGLMVLAVILFANAPSSAGGPTLGATVKMNAFLSGSVRPTPAPNKNFLEVEDLKPGASAATSSFTLTSENTSPVNVSLGLDQLTKNQLVDIPFAQWLEISFGEDGELGSTTLTSLAKDPVGPFKLQPRESKKIPVTISLPIAAGEQAGGQEARISIVPEVSP